MNIKKFKQVIESSHINFLFGSGLSVPYLQMLGNIENDLYNAEKNIDDEKIRDIVQSLLYAKYFKFVMSPCREVEKLKNKNDYDKVLNDYVEFIGLWNNIIARRSVELLNKQINIFSTNIDNFVEVAAETVGIEFNDGFKGHSIPTFTEDSFSNVVSRTSPLYNNSSMIPVFNLMKLHGSINWEKPQNAVEDNTICFSRDLHLLDEIGSKLEKLGPYLTINEASEMNFDQLKDFAKETRVEYEGLLNDFREEYENLIIVNPHKSKFRETVLDLHFYELMRLFSNALESANTILMVLGFSFADEHIANIVRRSANNNPTLLVIIFAYEEKAKPIIEENIGKPIINDNIVVVSPEDYKKWFDNDSKKNVKGLQNFDLKSLNQYVFNGIVDIKLKRNK